MTVIARCAWWCPACRWTASYDEPMIDVFCVRCMHEGRGRDQRCEKFVPEAQLVGAVSRDDLFATIDRIEREQYINGGRCGDFKAALDAVRAEFGGQ
jgi:hypothetical protein